MAQFRAINVELQGEETSAAQMPSSQSNGEEIGRQVRTTPPVGAIGYTKSYCEPCANVVEVSVVLEARGPD